METQIHMLLGFGEENEQEVKEVVKPTSSNYTWEEIAKYNERYNSIQVAVCRKVIM